MRVLYWFVIALHQLQRHWEDVDAPSVCHRSPSLWRCQFSQGWWLLCARYNLGRRYQPGLFQCHQQGNFVLSTNCQWNQWDKSHLWQEDCQRICQKSLSCEGFTYFNDSASPYPNFCETFPTVHSNIPCSNCVSGPTSCICSGPHFKRGQRKLQSAKRLIL